MVYVFIVIEMLPVYIRYDAVLRLEAEVRTVALVRLRHQELPFAGVCVSV